MIFLASSDPESGPRGSRLLVPLIRWLAPGLPAEEVEEIVFLLRKVAHFVEFAVLSVLLWRALAGRDAGEWRWKTAGLALLWTAVYAASDEFHQMFVPTRLASVKDVLIDTAGGAAALVITSVIHRVVRRR